MDLSFRSMATLGIIIGGLAWFMDSPGESKLASREPNASERKATRVNKSYKPDIAHAGVGAREEDLSNVNIKNDEEVIDASVGANVDQESARPADSEIFEKIRLEISQQLSEGNVDTALDFAEKKLAETLNSGSEEASSIEYLHDFILQHVDDPGDKVNVTVTAMKALQDENLKRVIFEKFQNTAPHLIDDLEGELEAEGIRYSNEDASR